MSRREGRGLFTIILITLHLVFGVAMAVPLQASTRVDLNGSWRFRIDRHEEGESQGWNKTLPTETEVVRVPHTWNVGKYDDYEGIGWYFRTLELGAIRGQHVELHFAASFYRSRVWLNGKLLGAHEGGHTPYWFDISSALRPADNFLAVELDNRPTARSIPGFALRLREGHRIWYDWWHYGGLVRDVWLTINDHGLIRRQRITSTIAENEAQITTTVFFENVSQGKNTFQIVATLYSPRGEIVGMPEKAEVKAVPSASAARLNFSVAHPALWDLSHPALYRMAVELRDEHGRLLDTREDAFGLRTIEIRDRHLFLNREQVRLTGMTQHEDSPWEGLAETAGTIKADYDTLEELHVRLTRPVHYPQHELVLDYADRHGILLIPEIPMWQFTEAQMKDPKVISLARQMFQEMIEEDENHPSIFAWSVCNESEATTKGGREYIDLMRDWIHQLDPAASLLTPTAISRWGRIRKQKPPTMWISS